MYIKPFRYERAASVSEACAILAEHGSGAKLLSGGQSLLPMMNLGLVEPEVMVDVGRISGLDTIAFEDGHLRIGALVRHGTLERDEAILRHYPLLAIAARHVGNARVRGRGTIGGSLAHNDPAAELPLALTVAGAEYEISDGASARIVGAAEFPVTYFTTQLGETEMLTSVRVPALGPGWGWGFAEVSRRPGDFAIVAAAALMRCAEGEVVEARVALTGVADRPVRAAATEMAVAGAREADLEARVEPIGNIEPVTDTNATAEHRRHLARVLVVRALSDACRRSGEAA